MLALEMLSSILVSLPRGFRFRRRTAGAWKEDATLTLINRKAKRVSRAISAAAPRGAVGSMSAENQRVSCLAKRKVSAERRRTSEFLDHVMFRTARSNTQRCTTTRSAAPHSASTSDERQANLRFKAQRRLRRHIC